MPTNYDEVVRKNKEYLTQAQINALAAAAKEFNVQNAGNRAGALSSAREQYDTGYRGLQNMGLAGATGAQPTSGEVPRLIQQVRTPFDDYNRRLQDVENRRLNALGGQFAQQTQQARAAAAAAQIAVTAARQASAQVERQRAEKLVRINNRNTLPSSPKITVADLTTPSVKEFDEPKTSTQQAKLPAVDTKSALAKAGMAVQQGVARAQDIAAAAILGISTPANRAVGNVERALEPATNQMTSPENTIDDYKAAQQATKSFRALVDTVKKGDREADKAALKEAERTVEQIDNRIKQDALTGKEQTIDDAQYMQEQKRAAEQWRDLAKLKVEDPDLYALAYISNSDADEKTKASAGTQFINRRLDDGADVQKEYEDAERNYNAAAEKVEKSRAYKKGAQEITPEIEKTLRSLEAMRKSKQDAQDFGEAERAQQIEEEIRQQERYLDELGYSTDEGPDLDEYADEANAELEQASEALAAAEFRYKDPDAYKAALVKQYENLLKDTNPGVVEWANKAVTDYKLKAMGIKIPGMPSDDYANAKGIRDAVARINDAQHAYDTAGEAETEDVVSEKDHAKTALDAAVRDLQDKFGLTMKEANDFLEEYDTERDARSEYNYYKPGMLALTEHQGETPSQPVNRSETNDLYRYINNLPAMGTITVPGTEEVRYKEDVSQVGYMTPEQKNAYNAIYEREGIEAANRFYNDIIPYLNLQRAQQDEDYYKKLSDEHPILADLRSVGANLLWNIPATVERLAVGTANLFSDEQSYYDTKSTLSYRAPRADIIRSERSQNILNNTNRSDRVNGLLNFAYQTGMSMADSTTAMAFAYAGAPWMVDALFFSSAGNSAYRDAKEKGATQDQAMAIGVLSGAAEAIFEHASIEHFMKMDYKGKGALIKNLLSQATAEGSEEVSTEIANTLTDAWIMRDKSEYNQAVREYSKTMSESEAKAKAFMDQLANIGMAGLGGAVSGALFGLGGALIAPARYNSEGKRLSKNTQEQAQVTRLAQLMGGEALESLDKYNAAKTNRNLGELSATVNQKLHDMFGDEKAQDVKTATKESVVDKATAYAALLSGERMTVNGADAVMKVTGKDTLQEMGYDTSTPKAFAQDYNKRLQKYGIQSQASVMNLAQTFAERENAMKTANASELSARQAAQRFASSQSYLRGDTFAAAGSYAEARQQSRTAANITSAKIGAANRVWENPNQGLAQTVDGNTVTPMPGNLTAVSFAEQQRTNFKANATATSGNVTYAVAGMQAREGLTNDQTLSEIKKGLTKEARNKAEVYEKLSKALGLKLTIHDVMVGTNGFIDENGNMHVVLSGRQSVLRVAAHELTHYMKDHAGTHYSALREHLIKDVGQATFDRMIARKALEYGLDTSTEKGRTVADDEVCAELCERMLSDEDALEKFAEKNTAAAKTLKDHLLKILNAIKAALKDKRNRDFGDSWSDLIKDQETIESWVEGLQEAIKNADARAATNEGQIGKVAGVTTVDHNDLIEDIKGAKTDAEIDDAINEHSVDVIAYDMAGYMDDLKNAKVMSASELKELMRTMNAAIDKVKAHRAILDYGAELSTEEEVLEAKKNRAYLPYKQNADPHYKLALDFSTLCRKRVLLQTIQERLQAKMGRALTQEETVAIRLALQKLQREGYKVEVACALCYVEAARLKSPKVINAFLNNTANEMRNYFAKKNPESKAIIEGLQQQWKVDHGLAPDATKNDMKAAGVNVTEYNNYSRYLREQFEGSASEETIVARAMDLVKNHRNVFLSASELTKLKKSDPDIFSAFTDKVRSATRSKAQETDTFYSRGDINMVTEAILNYANAESGFRHQSWSDFVPTHLLDTMAAVIEMSTRKAKMHAYTKVPAMVRLLGKTGMALNMSLIPSGNTGIDANGNLSFDSVEGMPWEVMMELRDMFPETAGNIAIGINGEQIQKLLASKDIDYVIPYHASGMNKNMRGYLDIRAWSEYTSSQNEKTNHRGAKGKAPELAEWFDEKAAAKATDGEAFMREASKKYLQLCYERNLTPKFSQYLQNNGDGSYSLKEGYENYWKMLTDRKMVNQKTGKVIIQQAVKPTFDQDTVLGILEDRLNDPAIQDAERAADIVTEQFSGWRADRNNADAEAIQAAKDLRDRTAAITAQKTAEAARFDLDTDAIRQAFTVIDTEGIEDGLEALKDVKHVGTFALKDISRMLDASAGKNKDLRNTLHAIFEKPHSEATGRYARGVERMQNRVMDIAKRAGVVDAKGKHFDSKKSAAIQNIGEGFSNTYTDLKLKVKDADHVTVKAYEQGTDKLVVSEKDYTLKELRKAYGTNAADYVWSQVFDKTQKAQETGKQAEWVEEPVNTRPYTLADLQAAFPNEWQQLKRAADEFRDMYDEYIRDQNNMLATIYPIESEFDTEEKLEGAIDKKQERLAQHKVGVNARITSINEKTEQRIKAHKEATDQRVASIEKRIEKLETEMAEKKRTDTKAFRDLQNRAFNLFADKENAIAEAAEYEAGQRAKAQALIDALKADLKEYEENAKSDLDRLGAAKAEAQNARQRGELDSLSRMHRLQYRSDYFHHFTEMASGIQNLRAIFTNNTDQDISPKIVGRSENTKAKARWAGYFQERMGGDYTADAIDGMLKYGQLAEYKLAFDPLTAYLRDVNKAIRNMDDNTNRDGLIRYIDQWADAIAGKSHKLDRNISDLGMAPRKAMQILNWINSRVIQNTLLFNARSALLQISNITNAMGIVKNINDWMNGLRSWALAAKGDEAMAGIMAQSNFLASRYMDNLQLTDSKLKSVKAFAGWLLGALDEISAKATWWAAYHQYIRNPNAAKNQYRTYDNAIDYADDVTRRTHAGRGVGELAPAMTSRVINFVAPFQVEVNNTFQLLKDNIKQGNYLGILSTGLSVFLFNALFEGIVGSSPLQFDFIRAVLDIVLGFAQDDPDDDKDDYGILQAWQRLSGEAFGSLPYAGQLASIIGEDTAKKLFGTDNDATRYGNTQIGINAVINAGKGVKDIATGLVEGRKVNWVDDLDDLLNLTLPFGAKQLTRTIEGVRAVAKGYEGKYDKNGKEEVHFTTDGDILEAIHAALFGKWSLTEASEYFGEKRLLPQLFGEYNGPKSSIGKAVDAKEYKAALQAGIDGKEYFSLKSDLSKYTTQAGKRAEMMQQKLTPEQKAKLDALMFGSKDAEMKTEGAVVYQKSGDEWKVKADYTNNDLFDLSQAGDKAYTGTLEAMEKTNLPQDQAALAASMWDRAKEADDRKAAFRSMLRDNANLTVEQKEALDLQYCGNKYPADYSDPELYDLSVTNRATYEKAKQAKAKGVPVSTFTGLSDKKAAHEGDGQAAYMRGEIMKTNLTAKQKELLDDLLVSDKGANPDYSSQAWFDVSMLGKTQYDKAKAGAKVGVKPEVYLAAYKKYKEVNRKEGDKYVYTKKEAKALLKAYMDKLPISAPVYDYIWMACFGYKSR